MRQKSKLLPPILLLLVLLPFLYGCGRETTKPDQDVPASTRVNPEEKLSEVYNLDRLLDLEPIKLRIVNLGLVKFVNPSENLKGHIALGLEIANTGKETVNFFPEQIVVTPNSGKEIYADVNISSDIGGTFPAKRAMQGFIIFPLSGINPNEITSLTIKFPAPQNEKHQPLGPEKIITLDIGQLKAAK